MKTLLTYILYTMIAPFLAVELGGQLVNALPGLLPVILTNMNSGAIALSQLLFEYVPSLFLFSTIPWLALLAFSLLYFTFSRLIATFSNYDSVLSRVSLWLQTPACLLASASYALLLSTQHIPVELQQFIF
jgi:hypothetical protein